MKVLKRGMDAAFYIRRNYEKLHVRSRSQAVAKYTHFAEGENRPRAVS
jgi:hypothetical protein